MSATRPLIPRSYATPLFGAAGAALLLAQALLPALPSDTTREVTVAAAHRGAEAASGVAFLAAGILLALGVAASNVLASGRGRALSRAGLIATGIGALWPIAGRAAFNAIIVAVTGGGVQRSVADDAVQAVSGSAAFSMFLPLLACFAVGPVLFALGLRRAGALSVWPALAWLAGVLVVNAAEGSSRLVATVGMLIAAAALAGIGAGVAKPTPTTRVPVTARRQPKTMTAS